MDVEKVNSLKEKGNKAYVDGKYDEALDFYQKALNSVGSGDTNIAAVLHSNISQAYLKKNDYLLAAESATESLKLDPSFMKSNLRRAAANVELDNITDAMDDLRLIFSNEPKNKAAKDLMKRCSDKPKMNQKLHEVYAKHYLRPVIKKSGAQDMGRRNQPNDLFMLEFQNALLRQSFLSMRGLNIGNYFFCKAFVGFSPSHHAVITFLGWIVRQFMWLGYSYSPIVIALSGNLFNLLYQLLQSETFSLAIDFPLSLMEKPLLLNKYLDVFLFKEPVLHNEIVDINDLNMMNHYSNDMTRLVYHPGLAHLKNKTFSKATALAFDAKQEVTCDFLKLWKMNGWPIESLFFVHGVPNFQILKQFKQSNGAISSKVNNVFIRLAEQNRESNKSAYKKLCNDLATLKSVFPNLGDVTITQRYSSKVWMFPMFARDLALIREAYMTFSTKPEWCSKLKVMVFVEFLAESRTESKMFDVKLLEQTVESLRQKHSDMKIRLCGPRSYDGFWAPSLAVPVVIEFENEVAQFGLAVCYNYSF